MQELNDYRLEPRFSEESKESLLGQAALGRGKASSLGPAARCAAGPGENLGPRPPNEAKSIRAVTNFPQKRREPSGGKNQANLA